MNVLFDNWDTYWEGFLGTLKLTVVASALALVLGVLVAACRVSPSPPCGCSARPG